MLIWNEILLPPELFPYLRRIIAYNSRNWAAVYLNLHKARRQWVMIVGVLESTVATVRSRGEIYKAVAQSVLLYGREIWVVTRAM